MSSSDHPQSDVLDRFRIGELRGQELLAVDDHLAQCADCSAAMRTHGVVSSAAESWRSAIAGAHLSAEQLEAHVDGTSNDAAAHIAACERCAAEVEDLRRHVRPRQSRSWIGLAAAAAIVIATTVLLTRPREPSPPIASTGTTIPSPPPTRPSLKDEGVTHMLAADGSILGLSPRAAETLEQLRRGVLPSAAIVAQVMTPADRLRGTGSHERGFDVAAPLGVIAEDRPTFTWSDKAGSAKYAVDVVDAKFERIAGASDITGRAWRPTSPLPRETTLEWQVTRHGNSQNAIAPEPPEPPARFRVISEAAAVELRRAAQRRSHLDLALIYAREGMIEEARREFAVLATLNPESKVVDEIRNTLEGKWK